ncbi:hypothetical protein M758_12G055400 [Ceratodon purpureus]|nr:hypothetical protein KC19_12G052700 [Ceratodon purpureus]KAG0553971.1 hypothetical protein KC19_12G052700 [Ceratodon purpureus]KAG0553972.1 hypothetical protein KC19_12G052700 [Ceratodon purpureus]KAG0598214.1 hypothetical protein M758_12G055400 [Ceratodon purpureus]KAG0598216.1 hypothetical protein M758_12G055400 [Ceratodon purpureus]
MLAVGMDTMETRTRRIETLVRAVGGLRQKVYDLEEQLVSTKTQIASIESEIASIDARAHSTSIKHTWVRLNAIGRSNAIEMEFRSEVDWDPVYAPMDPALWSTLPMEIQQLVFARLPWQDIIRLRCVSKQWKRCVSSENCEFMRLCTEVNPRMFAMINRIYENGTISVRVHDMKRYRWYHFIDRVVMGDEFCSHTMCAGDGGLVCIVTPPGRDNVKKRPLVITVCNPLTREQVELPSHNLCSVRPKMVQLMMDRERKCYKVIVVGKMKGAALQIYSSETRSWSSATSSADVIFGHAFQWLYDAEYLYEEYLGPCVYDCAKSQWIKLKNSDSPWIRASVESYVSVGDRLFVLHKKRHTYENRGRQAEDGVRYCISEYRGQKEKPYWAKVKVHRCKEFEIPPRSKHYVMHLKACKDFLLVFVENGESGDYRHQHTYLYELSTGIWQAISRIPEDDEQAQNDTMFELRWDAVP